MAKSKLLIIGDSIAAHYSPYLKKKLSGKFDISTLHDENKGLPETDSAILLSGLYELSDKNGMFDVLLFNCGLNDIKTDPETEKKQVKLKLYGRNIEAIAETAKGLVSTPVWVSTTPVNNEHHNTLCKEYHRYNEDVVVYNNMASQIMQDNGIPVIDLYSFTQSLGREINCDHVHFKDDIRKLQADFIANELENI